VRLDPRVVVPSSVEPSKNETVPVGNVEPAVAGATVAVNVTLPPSTWGFVLAVRVVVVVAVEDPGGGFVEAHEDEAVPLAVPPDTIRNINPRTFPIANECAAPFPAPEPFESSP
jgi:hypothetical protein